MVRCLKEVLHRGKGGPEGFASGPESVVLFHGVRAEPQYRPYRLSDKRCKASGVNVRGKLGANDMVFVRFPFKPSSRMTAVIRAFSNTRPLKRAGMGRKGLNQG